MERHNVRSVMIHSSSTICGCRFIPNTRCARMCLFFSTHGDVSKAEMAFTCFVRDPAHTRETELHLPTFSDLRCWQDWYLSPHWGGHLGLLFSLSSYHSRLGCVLKRSLNENLRFSCSLWGFLKKKFFLFKCSWFTVFCYFLLVLQSDSVIHICTSTLF